MKTKTAALIVLLILLVLVPTSLPIENSYSTSVVAKAYLFAFGTNSNRTGGYIFFDTAYVDASPINTVVQAAVNEYTRASSGWEIAPQYQNYPATSMPAHPTTFRMKVSLTSGSFNETVGSTSHEVNQTGPFIATISIPMGNLVPGNYSLVLKSYVNGTFYNDQWIASVVIG